MTWIFLWYTVDVWLDFRCLTLCNGCDVCSFPDTLCPTQLCVPMFYTSNISLIYHGHLVDSGHPTLHDGCSILFIIRQLVPNSAKCSDVAFLLWLEYFSNIPWMSGQTPDVQLCAMDAAFCIIRQLMPNLAECSDVFPFCYDSNISLIYCRRWRSKNVDFNS